MDGLGASAKALFGAADVIAAIPPGQVIENMQVQIKAEDVLDVEQTLGFEIEDLGTKYALEIRRGIVQFHNYVPDSADIVLRLNEETVTRVLTRQTTFVAAVEDGSAQLDKGSTRALGEFLSYFETPDPGSIRLVAR